MEMEWKHSIFRGSIIFGKVAKKGQNNENILRAQIGSGYALRPVHIHCVDSLPSSSPAKDWRDQTPYRSHPIS